MDSITKASIELKISELKENPIEYFMGIDTADEDNSAYCLMKKFKDNQEIILLKHNQNRDAMMEEVRHLAKYFNAEVRENGRRIL